MHRDQIFKKNQRVLTFKFCLGKINKYKVCNSVPGYIVQTDNKYDWYPEKKLYKIDWETSSFKLENLEYLQYKNEESSFALNPTQADNAIALLKYMYYVKSLSYKETEINRKRLNFAFKKIRCFFWLSFISNLVMIYLILGFFL